MLSQTSVSSLRVLAPTPAAPEAPEKENHLSIFSTLQLTKVGFVFLERQPFWLKGWEQLEGARHDTCILR